MAELSEPTSGWAAECRDCPFTVGADYGERIYPRWEFDDTDDGRHTGERWAATHRAANPGHNPTVLHFHRWKLTVEGQDWAPALLEALFPQRWIEGAPG
jgi:hypothetical protein